MKKTFFIVFACIIGFAGCSVSIPQPTMEELMDEVNAEHQEIRKPDISEEQYGQYVSIRSPINQELKPAKPDEDGGLSAEQAEFDINLLFDSLHKTYGLYDFYGGDAVFKAARQQAIADCKATEKMDADVLREIIKENLSFITDMHFIIDGENLARNLYPCFFTEVSFQKTQDGYSTTDGKTVESVDGQDDLDSLFKRSLTREGKIVYWPITFADPKTSTKNPPSLTVHYVDGSIQTLTAQPYEALQIDSDMKNIEQYEREDIPIGRSLWVDSQDFLKPAKDFRKEQVSIMDLSRNRGGKSTLSFEWWEDYLGQSVSGNLFSVLISQNMGMKELSGIEDLLGVQVIDGWTLLYTQPDDFVEQENTLIILTSKYTASAAEMFVDIARNVENTLIIGENTGGCLTNNLYGGVTLTYSGIEIGYGNAVTIFPEDDFKEGYGFEPDLWCPAVYAEEAAVNLIHNLMK